MPIRPILVGSIAAIAVAAAPHAIAQQGGQPPRPPAPRPPAPAQAPAPAQGQTESPQRTTATYNDWILQCETTAATPPAEICEIAQVTQVQGRNVPFSRIGVARPEKGQPVRLIVQVPVNVLFATTVRIQTSDEDPGIQAPFKNCTPNGCFAEFELKDDMLKKLRAASTVGKLSFADAGAHPVSVPISFNGFDPAFDALMKK